MISGIGALKLRVRLAAFLVLAGLLERPVFAQPYTISTIFGGLPADGAIGKTTTVGPYGMEALAIIATYGGMSTQAGMMVTLQ